ncbi:3-oxoacyl-ACP reductase family protein [Kitasatospora aureofaciens]|uniref:3-ketoacyl-ACP reductase n=3 Tax=Kitasatospora aureofaciens TaxID=1894 RepID=A0A1E7NCI9_KITAU|nr:3-oxoacyl-ACP reductase family protein [Kitasatospora aureofaciens]QEU98546.1 3-oxoacyl-ACP reductase FabG [Streptomyces viridifaciens]ARF82201.1 oxidoreductase [Kitasatospora aureofaciens]OEV38409.1 oxidoreductase [Kitasatospora aureofaciens]UKZ04493.1 3-oxoacyl-ACP reductase FabG [Streptomyces viridifaciens]GGU85210.1 3-ketoacyl-ACP reductase [Kitasatospora aureofaciens]
MSNELTGKAALVTGGSRGIGAAVAKRLAAEGAAVALTYVRAEEQARTVVKEIEAAGGRAVAIRADLVEPEAATRAVEETVRQLGGIDVLVNNAGFLTYGPLDEVSVEELDRVLAVDVRSVFLAAQAAARHMGEGGRIISIGSCFNGRVPGANFVLQATAKTALVGLTKGLARELGPRGITATVVDPGPIDTDMNPADGDSAAFQRSLTALDRFGEAEDIAAAVAFLAGPGGRYVTGTALAVDGGYTA